MTPRLLILGTLVVILICGVVCWGVQVANLQLGVLQFPPPAIGLLLVTVLVNRLLKIITPRLRLRPKEIAGLYIMAMIATMVTSRGLYDLLIPGLVGINYYSNPTNKWAETFYPHIHSHLVPWDPGDESLQPVSRDFYEGTGRWDGWLEHLPQWLTPLGFWLALAVCLSAAYYFLAALIRKQWIDHERLSFPLVQLPLELIREEIADRSGLPMQFLGKPLTWYGFALPVFVFALTGLHQFYPQVPALPTRGMTVNAWLQERPWSAIYFTPIYLSFAAIGFFYFIPNQLLLSLWFFFLFVRLQDVALDALGMPMENMPLYPCRFHIGHEVMGGYCLLAGYWIYMATPHLREVWAQITSARARHPEQGRDELLSYRTAFWGLLACLAGLMVWGHLAGLSLWYTALEFVALIFVLALVMARSTAEAGLPMTEISFRPMNLFELLSPMHNIGKRNLTVLGFLDDIFIRDQRGLLLTAYLDGSKLGDGIGMRRRDLASICAVALVVSLLVGGVVSLAIPYNLGGVTLYPPNYAQYPLWEFRAHQPAMDGKVPYETMAPVWFAAGVAITGLTAWMRTRFAWWPLSALAFTVSGSWTLIVFWFSILIAWILKTLIFRYGSMTAFLRARPFFLGMILGEFTAILGWSVVAFVTREPMPIFAWW